MPDKRKRIPSNNDVVVTTDDEQHQQQQFNLFSSTSWTNLKAPTIKVDNNNIADISYYNLFDSMAVVEEETSPTTEAKTFNSATTNQEEEDKANGSNEVLLRQSSVSSESTSFNTTSTSKNEKRKSTPSQITRDRKSGAFTFKSNSEYELMIHVQQGLDSFNFSSLSDIESADVILKSVDSYCYGKQWMFHIGQEKGEYIKDFLQECIHQKQQKQKQKQQESSSSSISNQEEEQDEPLFVIVELGTYCGYSAILLAKAVREYAPDLKFHIYSTEVDPKVVQVANNMIIMSKLSSYVTVILFEPSIQELAVTLQKHILLPTTTAAGGGQQQSQQQSQKQKPKIDFLFLDHAKNQYLTDLIHLEQSGSIQSGTYVAADNVIYNNLIDYQNHLSQYAKLGIVETKLAEMKLEYSDNIRDGIELTNYLQDPSLRKL